jgi:hypothetical protein
VTRPLWSRRRGHGLILVTGFLLSGALLAAPSAFSQDGSKPDPRLSLRKDPDYARLYHDGVEFLALPSSRQDAMRKLHDDLQKLPSPERHHLKEVLHRYADWLDKLPEADRQVVVNAPTHKARLQSIRKYRERDWLARQPVALRQYLAKLPKSKPSPAMAAASAVALSLGTPRQMRPLSMAASLAAQSADLRAETIARAKREEARKARLWAVATRHWTDLIDPKRPAMPAYAVDFGPEVEVFVKEYLRPALSNAEKARLDNAEGRWPIYPMVLVELADMHPMALPQKLGPTTFKDLPAEVQKRLSGKQFNDAVMKKKEQFFQKQDLNAIETRLAPVMPLRDITPSIKFACAVATFAHSKKMGVKLPHELWPTQAKDMSVPMRSFLDEKGAFWTQLTAAEHEFLWRAEGQWPEYPLKVQQLAGKYGFRPPWQTLPDIGNKGEVWDKYRLKPYSKIQAPP